MLAQFTTWFLGLVAGWFTAFWTFVTDAVVWVADTVLTWVAAALNAVPVPDWLSHGLSTLFSALDGGTMFLLTEAGIPQALGIIGAGFGFRLLRKLVTLFQW